MVNYISILVFVILLLVGGAVVAPLSTINPVLAVLVGIVWLVADAIIASAIQLAAQWQRAVVFRLGKFIGIRGPGLFFMIPVIEQVRMIDTRILAVHIPKQQVITRDNVPVTIDAALFYKVVNPADAIIMVQDYRNIILQFAQTSLRDVIGQGSLDQLLTEREQIAKAIEAHVERDTKGWGLDVTGLRIQDVDMPEELKKMMSRQASAEREKRATITKAEGDKEASVNLAAGRPHHGRKSRGDAVAHAPNHRWPGSVGLQHRGDCRARRTDGRLGQARSQREHRQHERYRAGTTRLKAMRLLNALKADDAPYSGSVFIALSK